MYSFLLLIFEDLQSVWPVCQGPEVDATDEGVDILVEEKSPEQGGKLLQEGAFQ